MHCLLLFVRLLPEDMTPSHSLPFLFPPLFSFSPCVPAFDLCFICSSLSSAPVRSTAGSQGRGAQHRGVALQPLELSQLGCFGVRVVWMLIKDCFHQGSANSHLSWKPWNCRNVCAGRICPSAPGPGASFVRRGHEFPLCPRVPGGFSFGAEDPARERSESQLGEL